MDILELHNKLLQSYLEIGKKQLRADFEFENLFEPPDCSYCGNGTIPVLTIIQAKYCPMCGRAIRKENNNVSTM